MCFGPYLLAHLVADQLTVLVLGVSGRQAHRPQPGGRVGICHSLVARKDGRYQCRAGVIAEVLGLIRPALDKFAQVQPGGHRVLVQVEDRETAGRVPTLPSGLGKARVQRIRPQGVGYPQPNVAVGQYLCSHGFGQCPAASAQAASARAACVQAWTDAKSNIARQASRTPRLSPSSTRSISDRRPSLSAFRRTAAGTRSALR